VEEFCRHYGTVMLPTKAGHAPPQGQDRSRRQVWPEQRAQGPQFTSLAEQNLFLVGLGKRRGRHAHSRHHPAAGHQGVQRGGTAKLLPLPASLFPVFEEAPRSVHRDGYVEVQRAYYSVPPEYVGRQVWVRWESRMVRVFNQRREQIALHALAEPGKFTTDPNHQHSPYRRVIQRNLDYLLDRARLIGKHTGTVGPKRWFNNAAPSAPGLAWPVVLAGKHPVAALEAAAEKALHHGTWRLRDLRTLLERPGHRRNWTFWKPTP
jgi:hypothetical protein